MRLAAALACSFLALPAGARPGEGAIAIRVAYQAPPECPAAAELDRQIMARSARIQIVPSSAALKFDVRIDPGWRARIEVEDAQGEESVREVSGETCRELVAAAALIVAVLADPDAPEEPPPGAPAAPPPPPAPRPAEPVRRPEPWPWHFLLGMQLSLEAGPAPDPMLAPRPFVGFEQRPDGALVRPAFRLSVARGSSGSIETDGGVAELTWTAARADGCVATGDDDGPSGQGCASFALGLIRGRGFRTRDPNDETVGWLAPGLLARGGWGFGSVLRVDLGAGLDFPLRRYRFYFGPDETAHRVPAVGLTAACGIAVILP